MRGLFIALLFLCIGGCSSDNLKYVGQVGHERFYIIHAGSIDGPNLTAIVMEKNGEATVEQQFSGPGASTSLYPAMGQVISSGVLKPSNLTITAGTTK